MIQTKIKWGPIKCPDCETCICSTKIEYRKEIDVLWTTPTYPGNPTQDTEYTVLIEKGVRYRVRLTHIGPMCKQKEQIFQLYVPLGTCCPNGFLLSPDADYCFYVEDIAAIPPSGSPALLSASTNISYSSCGTYIYGTGYSLNGTGTSTIIPLTNTFWVNGSGDCGSGNTTNGPLNRCGVWAGTPQNNQDIGFGVCLEVSETKQYYIGIGADNYGIIKVDGSTIIQQNPTDLSAQYPSAGIAAPFKVWHIYPVTLSAGPHILELIGHNDSGVAGMGCEVYNATSAEIIAATSYTDLGGKLIFSSKDYIGEEAQLGTQNAGYTCPEGYSIAPCADPIVCRKIVTSSTINC